MSDNVRETTVRPLAEVLGRLGACAEALAWAAPYGADWERAWAECPRGDHLLWLLNHLGADRKRTVLAACDCAELALPHVPAGEERPAQALAAARAWCRGEAALEEVRAAGAAATAAAANATYAAATAAAYAAATAAAYAADAAYAATAAAYAAYAAYAAAYAAYADALAQCAGIVRRHFAAGEVRELLVRLG